MENKNELRLSLDGGNNSGQIVRVREGDYHSRFIYLTLLNNNVRMHINEEYDVKIVFRLTNGELLAYSSKQADSIFTFDRNLIIEVPYEVMKDAGIIEANIILIKDDAKLTSETFHIIVNSVVADNDNWGDNKKLDVLTETINKANDTVENIIKLKESGAFKGADGFSPTVEMIEGDGYHTIKITDINGEHRTTIKDGKDAPVSFVTPEMFGAVGDGVTDDSTKIKNAILSGKKVVFDKEKTYLIASKIDISGVDCEIDFNHCSLIFGNSIVIKQDPLFTIDMEYSAESNDVPDTFENGIFNVKSKDKWSDSKLQYLIGFSSSVKKGKLETSFPYSLSGTASYYPYMSVKITNIGDVQPHNGYEKEAIKIIGCNVEIGNIHAIDYGEMTLFEVTSSKLYAHDFDICSTKRGEIQYYNYGISIASCSNFVLERINGSSAWHVVTIGGSSGVSFGGVVKDSTFVSNKDFVSYLDHENAFNTTYENCKFDTVYTCGGKFVNCVITNEFKLLSNYYNEYSQDTIFDGCVVSFPKKTTTNPIVIFHAEKFTLESKDYYYNSVIFKDCKIDFNGNRMSLTNTQRDAGGTKLHGHLCDKLYFYNCDFLNAHNTSVFIAGAKDQKRMFAHVVFEKCKFDKRSIYVYLTDDYDNVTEVYYINCDVGMTYVIGGVVRYYDCVSSKNYDSDATTDSVAIRCIMDADSPKSKNTKYVQCIKSNFDPVV